MLFELDQTFSGKFVLIYRTHVQHVHIFDRMNLQFCTLGILTNSSGSCKYSFRGFPIFSGFTFIVGVRFSMKPEYMILFIDENSSLEKNLERSTSALRFSQFYKKKNKTKTKTCTILGKCHM